MLLFLRFLYYSHPEESVGMFFFCTRFKSFDQLEEKMLVNGSLATNCLSNYHKFLLTLSSLHGSLLQPGQKLKQ